VVGFRCNPVLHGGGLGRQGPRGYGLPLRCEKYQVTKSERIAAVRKAGVGFDPLAAEFLFLSSLGSFLGLFDFSPLFLFGAETP
jgi:hypothetical protein